MVRFENLADKMDTFGLGKAEPWKLDIHQFANSLFQDVNPGMDAPSNTKIEQMDLQGVHPLREVKKFQWLAQGAPSSQ